MLRRLSDLKLLATFKGPTASQYPSSTHLISRLFSSTLTPPQSSSSTATPPYYSTTHPHASSSSSSNSSSPSITHGSSPSLSEQFSDLAPVILCPQPCRVVVIGWMGSRAKYIKRYVHLWERTGEHAVITIRPTILQTLLRFRGVVQAGNDIDKVARLQMENPAMPTFYHIFSTGGFIHAGTMWRWMDEVEDVMMRTSLLDEAAGIILDSGPTLDLSPGLAATALVSACSGLSAEALGSPNGPPSLYAGLVKPLLPTAESAMKLWLNQTSVVTRREEVEEAWMNRAPNCPHLYLYSDADPLVDPRAVEAFMERQSERGVEVTGHRFQGSGHCEHYRRHPHEYAMQISQFVAKAAEGW